MNQVEVAVACQNPGKPYFHDCTNAFIAARGTAGIIGGTIVIPQGFHGIDTSQSLNWAEVQWRGQRNSSASETVIFPMSAIGQSWVTYPPSDPTKAQVPEVDRPLNFQSTPVEVLPGPADAFIGSATGRIHLSDLTIDCGWTHDVGVLMGKGTLSRVTVEHASQAGFIFSGWAGRAERITARECANGIVLDGCSGASLHHPKTMNCLSIALDARGYRRTGATTTLSGNVSVVAAHLEIIGSTLNLSGTPPDRERPLLRIDGLEGGNFQLSYLHGGPVAVLVDGDAIGVTVVGGRWVPGKDGILIDLKAGRYCSFAGLSTATTTDKGARAHVVVDAEQSYGNEFGLMAPLPNSGKPQVWPKTTKKDTEKERSDPRRLGAYALLRWSAPGLQDWVAFARNGRLQSKTPPVVPLDPVSAAGPMKMTGRWEWGDVIENSEPASGEPIGWVYAPDAAGNLSWTKLPSIP